MDWGVLPTKVGLPSPSCGSEPRNSAICRVHGLAFAVATRSIPATATATAPNLRMLLRAMFDPPSRFSPLSRAGPIWMRLYSRPPRASHNSGRRLDQTLSPLPIMRPGERSITGRSQIVEMSVTNARHRLPSDIGRRGIILDGSESDRWRANEGAKSWT